MMLFTLQNPSKHNLFGSVLGVLLLLIRENREIGRYTATDQETST